MRAEPRHAGRPAHHAHTLSTCRAVSGILFGPLVIGFFADRIGRKVGSIITASTMLLCECGAGCACVGGRRRSPRIDYYRAHTRHSRPLGAHPPPRITVGILICASDGPDSGVLFTMFTVMQFFFGIGVGGEVRGSG